MTEKRPDTVVPVESELRAQLARRLAVAGALVAVLLGVLAIFDRFSQPAEEEEVAVYTRPVPVAPPKMLTQPVTPAEPEAAPPAEAAVPESAEPATVDAGEAPPPPPPDVAANPSQTQALAPTVTKTGRRNGAPAEAEVVPEMTAPPQLLPTKPAVAPLPEPAKPALPVVAAPAPTPAAKVLTTTPGAARPPAAETPAAPRLFSGFVLQAGVFASAQRAEELHARLTLNGVPSQIEARVQVGPFRTRREAAAAQAKLRELGIESMLVEPKGNR
ncbi:SPOR domain-containing protein [Azonexus sp.]|uniref:SPOR domain-containing protein n=1 Tax=Azonexus sp. TaxID=1872668 RepID=UPI0035B20F38